MITLPVEKEGAPSALRPVRLNSDLESCYRFAIYAGSPSANIGIAIVPPSAGARRIKQDIM